MGATGLTESSVGNSSTAGDPAAPAKATDKADTVTSNPTTTATRLTSRSLRLVKLRHYRIAALLD